MSDTTYTMSEPPHYSITCECGITISGTSERGLSSLLKRHKKDGVLHTQWDNLKNKFGKIMIDDIPQKETSNER